MAPQYIAKWPQSRERIVGTENFVAINAHYPGSWAIAITRLVADDDQVVTEVRLTNQDAPGDTNVAVSFFRLRDGLITEEVDWWPESHTAPEWRAHWVEPMD